MANSFLTIDMITREAIRLFRNTNAFIQNIDSQYDDMFAVSGAKIGDSVRIRLPNDYKVSRGPNIDVQDTAETQTTLTLQYQDHVDVAFTSKDRTLELDDFSERILMPMINNLAGSVASTVMGLTEGNISNIVTNVDSGSNIITPTQETWLLAGAKLTENSYPDTTNRKLISDPTTNARVVSSLAGLFQDGKMIAEQYRSGLMKGFALGFQWYNDQTVLRHTTGSFSAGTVNGAGQTGTTLTVNAITGTLTKGDIITIDSVNAVNRVTKQDTGVEQQFVVTAAAANGATSLSIYPAIVATDGSGNTQAYQTVTASPADSAAISLATPASGTFRRNFVYGPDAITMASADLVMPGDGVVESARENFDGVAMRYVSQYVIGTDQLVGRLDVLYGALVIRPEWCCIVADAV